MTTFYAKSHNGRWISKNGTSASAQEAKEFRTRAAAEKAMNKAINSGLADETTGIYTIDFSRPETPETRV